MKSVNYGTYVKITREKNGRLQSVIVEPPGDYYLYTDGDVREILEAFQASWVDAITAYKARYSD